MGEPTIQPGVPSIQPSGAEAKQGLTKADESAQRTADVAKKTGVSPTAWIKPTPRPISGAKLRSATTSQPPSFPKAETSARTDDVATAVKISFHRPDTKAEKEKALEENLNELKQAGQLGSYKKIIYEGGRVQVRGRSFLHLFFPLKSGTSPGARTTVMKFYEKAKDVAENPDLSPTQLQELQKAVKDFSNSNWGKKVLDTYPGILNEEAKDFKTSFQKAFLKKVEVLFQKTKPPSQEDVVALQHTLAELESTLPSLKGGRAPLALARDKLLEFAGKIYSAETKKIADEATEKVSKQLKEIQEVIQTEHLENLNAKLVIETISKIASKKDLTFEDLKTLNQALKLIEDSGSFKELKKEDPTSDLITGLIDSRKTLDAISASKLSEKCTKSEDLTTRVVRAPTEEALTAAGVTSTLGETCSISAIGHAFIKKLVPKEANINFSTQCPATPPDSTVKVGEEVRTLTEKPEKEATPIHSQQDAVSKTEINVASAYPFLKGERDGDPIADDAQMVSLHTENPAVNLVVYSGADGCGWGEKASKAAQAANKGFIEECSKQLQGKPLTLESVAHAAIEGVTAAQKEVESSNPPDPGTTTHTGIVLLKDTRENSKSYAVFTMVGDMKVFIRDKDGKIKEPTLGAPRGGGVTDPGGRLGREIHGAAPDLRNFGLYIVELSPGDAILPMSDGVHDNLNPELLGLSPQEAYKELTLKERYALQKSLGKGKSPATMALDLENKWKKKNLNSPWRPGEESYTPFLAALKASYMRHKIRAIDTERTKHPNKTLARALIEHAIQASLPIRTTEEATGGLPSIPIFDEGGIKHLEMTGKPDHISCGWILV